MLTFIKREAIIPVVVNFSKHNEKNLLRCKKKIEIINNEIGENISNVKLHFTRQRYQTRLKTENGSIVKAIKVPCTEAVLPEI